MSGIPLYYFAGQTESDQRSNRDDVIRMVLTPPTAREGALRKALESARDDLAGLPDRHGGCLQAIIAGIDKCLASSALTPKKE